jgi:hypothetical protein
MEMQKQNYEMLIHWSGSILRDEAIPRLEYFREMFQFKSPDCCLEISKRMVL